MLPQHIGGSGPLQGRKRGVGVVLREGHQHPTRIQPQDLERVKYLAVTARRKALPGPQAPSSPDADPRRRGRDHADEGLGPKRGPISRAPTGSSEPPYFFAGAFPASTSLRSNFPLLSAKN